MISKKPDLSNVDVYFCAYAYYTEKKIYHLDYKIGKYRNELNQIEWVLK